jgi:hypothetical protein
MIHHPAWRAGVAASLLAAAMLGCAATAGDAAPPRPPPELPAQSPELARHIEAALADAALRTGINAAALKIASAERVTWLDGSLGCPEPDVLYTQALVPGYRIRIQAGGGETLDYHASTGGATLLCPPGRAVDPNPARRRTSLASSIERSMP